MTHINEAYAKAPNRYRIGEPLIDLNFGLVEIEWAKGVVQLGACDVDGRVVLHELIHLSSLRAARQ